MAGGYCLWPLGIFFQIGMFGTRKIWQTCLKCENGSKRVKVMRSRVTRLGKFSHLFVFTLEVFCNIIEAAHISGIYLSHNKYSTKIVRFRQKLGRATFWAFLYNIIWSP
jgi:hypothetical protein